jgi:hypothetical protein
MLNARRQPDDFFLREHTLVNDETTDETNN